MDMIFAKNYKQSQYFLIFYLNEKAERWNEYKQEVVSWHLRHSGSP